MEMKFKELSSMVIRDYPYPIASLFQKYNKIPTDNYAVRHNQLCDIFEATLKLLAIVLMKEAVQNQLLGFCFPYGMDFIKHPSLGHWMTIIREIAKNKSDDSSTWTHKVAEWLFGTVPSQEILKHYAALPEVSFPPGRGQVAGILNSLVTYRNQVWKGHGVAVVSEDSLAGRVAAIEQLFVVLFATAPFFQQMNLFYVKEVKKVGKNKHEANCASLVGAQLDFAKYVYDDFEPKEIYLAPTRETELKAEPLMISPLAEMQVNNNNLQFYFFNDAKRSKLQYLSYADGSFYYFKEDRSKSEKWNGLGISRFGNNKNKYVSDLTNLSKRNLKLWTKLSLSGFESLQNVDGLSNLTKLTKLDLSRCESLQNVDGLSNLTNLTELDLRRC